MVYSAPELLLIGAAQSLVLGAVSAPADCEPGDAQPGQSDETELW